MNKYISVLKNKWLIAISSICIIAFSIWYFFPQEEPFTVPSLTIEYGIIFDNYYVNPNKIERNQQLASILHDYKVDNQTIYQLSQKTKNLFDLRRIRVGNKYIVFCKKDTTRQLKMLVYEISPSRFIVFDLRDSIHVHIGEKEIITKIKTASGLINGSLWNTLEKNKTNPELALELADIFAWSIDFYGIQDGDSYKIIYEELTIDNKPIGFGDVIASSFKHNNKTYNAFYFAQDSMGNYFNEKGENLKKAFLKAPLKFRRISSGYSNRRFHPILRIFRPHHGIDYSAPKGTPVHTIGNGTITYKGYTRGGGNTVKIKHNGVYETSYMHLAGYARNIRQGKRISQGDLIGYVGSTGLSSGPHLDFRVYKNGHPTNPLTVESPPAEPVKKENLNSFLSLATKMTQQLSSIKITE